MQEYTSKELNLIKNNVIDNVSFSYIKESSIHGLGLFASESIKAGTILGILDGQIIKWNEYENIVQKLENEISDIDQYLFMEWNAVDEETLLVRPLRTKYSFINHSRTPNLEIVYNPIRIVAISDIKVHEEYLLDYRKEPLREEYLEGHGKKYL
ncbi:MAG: SET domain-containing protein [Bacillota bacterium]